jgi:hypothetical protein
MSRRLVLGALAAIALAGARDPATASAECRRHARGRPIYREVVAPFVEPPPGQPTDVQRQTLAVYPDGTWTWLGAAAFGDDEAMGRTGCVAPRALRELRAAVARAKFRTITAPTCAAVNTRRVDIEAPRRRKRVVTARPCGQPLDPATAALVECAALVTRDRTATLDDLRTTCRPAR